MSTTGRTAETASAASGVATALRDAGFVRLVARADGDALAASGLLASALADTDVPFQASVTRTDAGASDQLDDADGTPLSIGMDVAGATVIPGVDCPASVVAFEAARELGDTPDPVLALSGAFAAGTVPGAGETAPLLEAATESGRLERGPGVAVPTGDLRDGLTHSTLVHASFSARPDEADRLVDSAGGDSDDVTADGSESDRRRLASLVAVETAGNDAATSCAAQALERALRPYYAPDDSFVTIGGYADVLCALAREQPGTGVALALGSDVVEAALDVWRDHASHAHEGVREASTSRYDGLVVAHVSGAPVETTARLLAEYRSQEPMTLVVSEGEAAVRTMPDAEVPADALRTAAESFDGGVSIGPASGYATFDGDGEAFVTAFREAQ